ncbi:alanine racemase [Sphingomonas gilva]|uniref:alanine racemase n=1 Tax=Sphingomonas gilva TaxID=2305907 RepID=A0A396RK81_9SPHN|nr:alanine racemase [Sphingomonas gilva]RHW16628.1 alanine racemase [Sphingomonas gilva]
MTPASSPLRLRLDGEALGRNWRWLASRNPLAACGAAIKSNGYGLGAVEAMMALANAGCRDFFVATWAEAMELEVLGGLPVSVLHGVREDDMALAHTLRARPVLSTPEQVKRWLRAKGGACDVMVDTGMNRLGVSVEDVVAGLLDNLEIDTLMSHLACADEDSPMNARQRAYFAGLAGRTKAKRMSLANSAGIMLGEAYAFDLVRPGLALYGGVPRPEMAGHIRPVVQPEVEVLQRRLVHAGESVGYNAIWTAKADTEVAIVNLGYADGYSRGFSNQGSSSGGLFPVIGRVSMDLVSLDVSAAPEVAEGDWLAIDYDLPTASAQTGLSQYELLTGLGNRFKRYWV